MPYKVSVCFPCGNCADQIFHDLHLYHVRFSTGQALGIRGRGHDALVNCVRTAMSKSVSKPKPFVAANAIYSHKSAGHNALASTFVGTYEDSPVILLELSAFPKTGNL